MNLNAKPSEMVGVVGNIDPDAYAAGTVTSGWIAAKSYLAFMAIIQVGDMVATSTVNAKLEQATSAAGAGAKDITGKAITALTQAGADDNKQAVINLRPEEMDVDSAFTHFRLSMTVAAAASDSGGIVLGFSPVRGSATDIDAATVDEVVA